MKQYEVVNVDGEAVTYTIENESEQPSGLVAKFSVFEIGNHGDISITNPFTGKRLWVSASAFDSTTNLYVAMRRVITVAEKLHFLGDPANNLSAGACCVTVRRCAVTLHVLTVGTRRESSNVGNSQDVDSRYDDCLPRV